MKSEDTASVAVPAMMETSMARRIIYILAGIFFVAVAGIGVLLPGIPTVGPLLLASFFLTKSSPGLERSLVRNRFFSPYLKYMDGSVEMPWRARIVSLLLMWVSIFFSSMMLMQMDGVRYWGPLGLVGAGLVGSWFIWNFGKRSLGSKSSRGIT